MGYRQVIPEQAQNHKFSACNLHLLECSLASNPDGTRLLLNQQMWE